MKAIVRISPETWTAAACCRFGIRSLLRIRASRLAPGKRQQAARTPCPPMLMKRPGAGGVNAKEKPCRCQRAARSPLPFTTSKINNHQSSIHLSSFARRSQTAATRHLFISSHPRNIA
jgi:hypothetical protein